MLKRFLWLALVPLSGCAQFAGMLSKSEVPETTVVIAAGHKVQIGDEVLTIWGEDACQPGFTGTDRLDCVQLSGRAKTRVHFIRNGMLDVEDWVVEQDGRRFKLKTPAGRYAQELFR